METAQALAPRDPVKAALSFTHDITSTVLEKLEAEKGKIDQTLSGWNAVKADMFGIEKEVIMAGADKYRQLGRRRDELDMLTKTELRGCPLIHLEEPLSWRTRDGFPALAPFSLESDTFQFCIRRDDESGKWKKEIMPEKVIPAALKKHYADVFSVLKKKRGDDGITATAKLSCLIPQEIKARITEVRKYFTHIFLVAEALEWSLKPVPRPRRRTGDPLVVGYDGHQYRLIGAFDMTSLEQAVLQRTRKV
jgi:hypothetical protein